MLDFVTSWIFVPLGLVFLVSIYKAFRRRGLEFYLLALCAALQVAALYLPVPGMVMVAPLVIGVLLPRPKSNMSTQGLIQVSPPTALIVVLGLIVASLAALTRLKGIESLAISGPNDFGWETYFSYMAASSWHTAVMSGIKHHSISQGFLWHVMYYVMHTFTEDPIIGGRIFFAVVSLCNILLVFLVSRVLFGNWVGIIACALFAFAPLEPAWARSNYGMTLATFLSLAVAYVTFRSLALSQVLLSALTMLSYPAATTMGIFPLIVGFLNRSRRAIMIGLAGVALWIIVPSLVVSVTEGSLSWISPLRLHGSDRSIIDTAKRSPDWASALVEGVSKNVQSFVKKTGTFSDGDEYFVLSALKPKYLLGRITLLFLPVGLYLIRGTKAGTALLVWLGLSVITAFTSIDVIPRRFCTFVAPVSIISGYGAAVVVASLWQPFMIALITTVTCGMISFTTYFRDLRAPHLFATNVVALVEQEMRDSTLVLLDNIPAPCVAWIFTRLDTYAQQGSYISYRAGGPERQLELTNKVATEMPWYKETALKGTVLPGPVSRIVLFSTNKEPPANLAPGLAVTEQSALTVEWLTIYKFVVTTQPTSPVLP